MYVSAFVVVMVALTIGRNALVAPEMAAHQSFETLPLNFGYLPESPLTAN